MKIVALDISGNFKEGKGTTGIAELIDGEVRAFLHYLQNIIVVQKNTGTKSYEIQFLGNQMLSSLKAICSTTTRA